MTTMSESVYARHGVDTEQADRATAALVAVLGQIDPGRPRRALLRSGHYANILRLTSDLGVAVSADGIGSKAIVAEQLGRFNTVGIDCVAMNANDVICVGAEPIAMLDYLSVAEADEAMLVSIAEGLKAGAEMAHIEIPGGEVAQLPGMVRSHGEGPTGFDLVGTCLGVVRLDSVITGDEIEPGNVLVGIPASGVHANGLTLARAAFPDLHEPLTEYGDASAGDVLLTPTTIYVEAVGALLESSVSVRGLAHITSESFLNLLRMEAAVGYRIDSPLPVPPIFKIVSERTGTPPTEMWDVFNMGCGFCCIVDERDAEKAVNVLSEYHRGTAIIGKTTTQTGVVELPKAGLIGTKADRFQPAQSHV